MSTEGIAALAAAISGIGGVISAYLTRRRMLKDCEQRIESFREGLRLGRGLDS